MVKNDEFMAKAFLKKLAPTCPALKEMRVYSLESRKNDTHISAVAMSEVEGMKCYIWFYTEKEINFETAAKRINRDSELFRKVIRGKAEGKGITEDQALQRMYFEAGESVLDSETGRRASKIAFDLVEECGSEGEALKKLQETDLKKAILAQT